MRKRVSWLLCALLALALLLVAPGQAQADKEDVVLASCTSGGVEAGGLSLSSVISGGGRYIAFYSTASNLLPGISGFHIFRKDVASGEVLLCSASSSGAMGNGASDFPAISSDGTYVVFRSDSSNFIPGHPTAAGRKHIFRKDLVTGEVMLCSAAANGTEGNGDCETAAVSDDGRYVAFQSASTNLIVGHPTASGRSHVFRKDLATGEVALCSTSASGVDGNSSSLHPSLNSDGSYVVFQSTASNLIDSHPTLYQQIFRKNLVSGEVALVSTSTSGIQGNNNSYVPDISAGGRYVSFLSQSTNLIDGYTTTDKQIFRKDLQTEETILCSSNILGIRGNKDSFEPVIDASGSYVAFTSLATNLSIDANTGSQNVLRKNVSTGEVTCCSISASGIKENSDSYSPGISSDGRFVCFDSEATNLIDGEPTSGRLIFRKELASETSFYFAEGYTGAGFQEYLCLGNPGESEITVAVTYSFTGDEPQTDSLVVPAGSRVTVDVNAKVGAGREVSIHTASRNPFVAERPIYFDYGDGWTGGHDVVGASCPDTSWYFAEGYTGPGFDEWVCVLNPGNVTAELSFRFQTQEEGELVRTGYAVEPNSRATFKINDVLGAGYQTSLTLQSDQPVVAERPMYFDYLGTTGGHHWNGGHCVIGTTYLKRDYYFAEGYTGAGFEEWLTLQNPNPLAISVRADYQFADGAVPLELDYEVPAGSRRTIYVPDEVGTGRDVSVELGCDFPFLAERPMYFVYSGMGGYGWTGGHCVIGASFRRSDLFFAEGYTGPGFEEWLCIQNPGTTTTRVRIYYYTQEAGPLPPREEDIPAGSRVTFLVNSHAGTGYQLSSRVEVVSGPWIVVERPMYFNFNGAWTGGHDVVGYGL